MRSSSSPRCLASRPKLRASASRISADGRCRSAARSGAHLAAACYPARQYEELTFSHQKSKASAPPSLLLRGAAAWPFSWPAAMAAEAGSRVLFFYMCGLQPRHAARQLLPRLALGMRRHQASWSRRYRRHIGGAPAASGSEGNSWRTTRAPSSSSAAFGEISRWRPEAGKASVARRCAT